MCSDIDINLKNYKKKNIFDIENTVIQDKLLKGKHYDLLSDFEQGLESFDFFCLKNSNLCLIWWFCFFTSLIWLSNFEMFEGKIHRLKLVLDFAIHVPDFQRIANEHRGRWN